jgi:hypothetical protein
MSNMVVAASWFGPAFLQQGQGRWLKLMGRWMEPNSNQIIKSNQILFVTYTWLADVNASVAKCLCF